MKKVNKKQIIGFAGTFIAFMMGSGFATGQEVLQYFAAYGYKGILGIALYFLALLYASERCIRVGFLNRAQGGSDVFAFYCGKKLGTFFNWFTAISVYICFIVMLSGAGATLHQHYGISSRIGSLMIGTLTCVTVMMGLGRIVDVIGKIGPVLIAISLFLSTVSIFKGAGNLASVETVLQELHPMRASGNWLLSTLSYVGISLVWLAPFLSALGEQADSIKEAKWGARLGACSFCAAMLLTTLGIMANLEVIAGSLVPNLVLANRISSVLGMVFSLTIVCGTYTAAVPLLWIVVAKLAPENSRRFQIITLLLVALGLIIGTLVSFDVLVNTTYVTIGYVGFILLLFMILKRFKK